MTEKASLMVIYSRLTETVDIFRDNRKLYKGERMESICALRYGITVCNSMDSFEIELSAVSLHKKTLVLSLAKNLKNMTYEQVARIKSIMEEN